MCVWKLFETLSKARENWPEKYERILMARTTFEIFTRFNSTLDGVLDGEELGALVSNLAQHAVVQQEIVAHSRDAKEGVDQLELGRWFESREDWFALLFALGYEPGATPKHPPVLVASRPIAISRVRKKNDIYPEKE